MGYNPLMLLSVASIVPFTEAEGPGKRFALWFQGCPLRCPGCCNPEFLPFAGGTPRELADVVGELERNQAEHGLEGVTLLGGEPFAHAEGAAELAETARTMGLSVMVFTGYLLEDLRLKRDPKIDRLLARTDLLIDGPYDRNKTDITRRWIGSTNQRIHFLSERYSADDSFWKERNTLEIRICGLELTINGFPAGDAKALWKGWRRK